MRTLSTDCPRHKTLLKFAETEQRSFFFHLFRVRQRQNAAWPARFAQFGESSGKQSYFCGKISGTLRSVDNCMIGG